MFLHMGGKGRNTEKRDFIFEMYLRVAEGSVSNSSVRIKCQRTVMLTASHYRIFNNRDFNKCSFVVFWSL